VRLVQITAGIAEGDAVTNYALGLDAYFREKKIFKSTAIFAEAFAGRRPKNVHHLATYTPLANDIIVYHHSVGLLYLDSFLLKDVKPLIVYHNITPSQFYLKWDFRAAARMDLGRRQLHRLAQFNSPTVALSEFSANELRQTGFKNVTVLPYPILNNSKSKSTKKENINQDQRWQQWINESTPYLLYVGRIAPNKGIDNLLKIFDRIKKLGDYRLIIVGAFRSANDSYGRYLRDLVVDMQLQAAVCWTGYVDDQDLLAIRSGASVFLSLSEHEGFGVPFVEAMVSQVPILAYCCDSSSVSEVLGGCGIGFSTIDYDWLTKVTVQLIHDHQLRELVIDGQNRRLSDLQAIDVFGSFHKLIQDSYESL
ncbi:MAG: glycosyltransferase, partial [Leptonema sp. (in: Bacteria)]|nr:glycosyltransferase [Leptonema sp. (in: bacteria)]